MPFRWLGRSWSDGGLVHHIEGRRSQLRDGGKRHGTAVAALLARASVLKPFFASREFWSGFAFMVLFVFFALVIMGI